MIMKNHHAEFADMLNDVFPEGKFIVGCNYWASHAGTAMWKSWSPETVAADFAKLAAAGLQLIRVFPLWPDFQPLHLLYGGGGAQMELRHEEKPFGRDAAGRAGVDPVMMERFRTLADLALQHGLQLEVSLLNGWMSGRLFAPPALAGLNLLADPKAIRWEVRFVRYFVGVMKEHPAIRAWSPGNECNCMAPADRDQAWQWMNTIVSAIRLEDPTRIITSGMHSLVPTDDTAFEGKNWTIQDQAEHVDLLTTHPYPEFTPHAMRDPVDRFRNCFHAAAECAFYGDIGGKPAIAEEIGTLAAMIAGEEVKAAYVRNTLFNLWAHGHRAFLWWCAFDQLHLEQAPYDWYAVERELGLIDGRGEAKPVLSTIGAFRKTIEAMPFESLPPLRRQAVCILSRGQDNWGNAWSAFLLAKQAGFDLEFQYISEPLKPSGLYLLPGLSGGAPITRTQWHELLRQVEQGATLYASLDDGFLAPFNQVFGVEVQTRSRRAAPVEWQYGNATFRTAAGVRSEIAVGTARVLATEADGNPVFLSNAYGKGRCYLLTVPLEKYLAESSGLFPAAATMPFYSVYQEIADRELSVRLIRSGNPLVSVSEHGFGEKEVVAILVNNQPQPAVIRPRTADGWQLDQVLYGRWSGDTAELGGNDALIVRLVRR